MVRFIYITGLKCGVAFNTGGLRIGSKNAPKSRNRSCARKSAEQLFNALAGVKAGTSSRTREGDLQQSPGLLASRSEPIATRLEAIAIRNKEKRKGRKAPS